jgi:hypothetical protein
VIQVSGTGPQAKTTLQVWSGPEGFYTVGAYVMAAGVSAAPAQLTAVIGKDIDDLGFQPAHVDVNLTAAVPAKAVDLGAVFLQPGDSLEFRIQQFNFGMNPDADWVIRFYLYASAELAYA